MIIGNYEFMLTCSEYPEQYEVFDKDDNHVCYVRLRWGHLTAECPDVGGSLVYEANIGRDGLTGCFESEKQRMIELKNIADRIDRERVRLGDFKIVKNEDYLDFVESRL